MVTKASDGRIPNHGNGKPSQFPNALTLGCDPQPVRRFGTFPADLDALADWLLDGGVPTVAMASTGVSWLPLFKL